jgi:cellulose synthase/poly-beta-1,6-N-acetylglucosamine synthase-like glycosyltransferase
MLIAEERTSEHWAGSLPSLSIVIPTHNHAAFLPELMTSLEKQTMPRESFEVIVVDDASTDSTWEVLSGLVNATPLRMRAARADHNVGPGSTRNAGVTLARGHALAFTDDDCLPSTVWAEELARAVTDGLDLVQGRTLPQPRTPQGPWDRYVWVTGSTPLFESCNLAVSRIAFEEAGGFPTARPDATRGTRSHFGEDVEIGWKIRNAGRRTGYSASALVHHRMIPGRYADWLAEQRRMGLFPGLVRRVPGLRRELLRLGVFLSANTARFDLAVAGVTLAAVSGRPWVAAAGLPWLRQRWREATARPGRTRLARLAQYALGDGLGLVSLVAGSVRDRRLVL